MFDSYQNTSIKTYNYKISISVRVLANVIEENIDNFTNKFCCWRNYRSINKDISYILDCIS